MGNIHVTETFTHRHDHFRGNRVLVNDAITHFATNFIQVSKILFSDEDDDFIAFSSDKEFREALKSVGNGTLKVYVRGYYT